MRWHRYLRLTTLLSVVVLLVVCGGNAKAPPAAAPTAEVVATPATSVAAALPTPTPVPLPPQILFSGVLEQPNGAAVTDYGIYVVGPDGSGLHRLDQAGMRDYYPSWSPDGRSVAFTRQSPGATSEQWPKSAIVVMDADGSNPRLLTDPNGMAMYGAWSPDGKRIAFERIAAAPAVGESVDAVLSVINADGSELRDIGRVGSLLGVPSWSPDGSRLAFNTGTLSVATQQISAGISVVGADGGNLKQIVGPGDVMWPSWSPDGTTIIYTTLSRTSNTLAGLSSISIDAVRPDGTGGRSLTRDQVKFALLPAWSTDGRQIAFTGSQGFGLTGIDNGIYAMNADGSNFHVVVQGAAGLAADVIAAPAWSPDGHQLAYVAVPLAGVLGQASGQSQTNLVGIDVRVAGVDGALARSITGKVFVELTFSPFNTAFNLAPAWRPGTS